MPAAFLARFLLPCFKPYIPQACNSATKLDWSSKAGLRHQANNKNALLQLALAIAAYLFQPHQADRMFYPHSALLSWTRWFCRGLYPEGQNLLTLAKEHMCYVYSTL